MQNKKIKCLTLENFEAYQNETICFSPYLNFIIGKSDSGKSSIVRAIRLALFNDLKGSSFVSKGKSASVIKVCFEDGTILVRKKGTADNLYKINDKVFSGFGDKLPAEVKNLNFRTIPLTEGFRFNLNIQKQEDEFLLFQISPTMRQRLLDWVTGLSFLEKLKKFFEKGFRSITLKESLVEKDIKALTERLERIPIRKKVPSLLSRAQRVFNEATNLQKKNFLVKEYKRNIHKLILLKQKLPNILKKFYEIKSKVEGYKKFTDLGIKRLDIEKKIGDIIAQKIVIEKQIENGKAKLKGEIYAKGICPLCKQKIR